MTVCEDLMEERKKLGNATRSLSAARADVSHRKEKLENHKLYCVPGENSLLSWSLWASMWSVLNFCYTMFVILRIRKNRVNTLYCWTRQISMDMKAEERKGDWRQRIGYAVDLCKLKHNFSQEDLAMRFGVNQSTMWRLYSCRTKILEACINEFPGGKSAGRAVGTSNNSLRVWKTLVSRPSWYHNASELKKSFTLLKWVSPLAGQDFSSGKCASYFQEPLSWHTCHHRFCGDWDWPLSQPDAQSLTSFDYKHSNFQELHHLSIHKCIATSRLVKLCTFLTTLISPLVDLPPKKEMNLLVH